MFTFLLTHLILPDALAALPEPTEKAAEGPVIEAALLSTARSLDDTVSQSRLVLLGLTSVKSDYAQYRKVEALRETLRKVKDAVHNVNVLLPGAIEMSKQYKAEMTPERLKELFGRNPGDIERYAFSIETDLETWSKARHGWVVKVNDDARADLDQAQRMYDDSSQDQATDFMEMWVIGYHKVILDAVDLILPPAAENPEAAIPLTPDEEKERERTAGLKAEIEAVAAKVAAVKAAIAEAHRQKVSAARFPKGAPPEESGVAKALAGEFGTPLRMARYAPWMVREEAYWSRGVWVVGTYRYLSVWLAAKTPSGATYVYLTQVVSKKSGGQWGPIRFRGVSDSFEILPENLKK